MSRSPVRGVLLAVSLGSLLGCTRTAPETSSTLVGSRANIVVILADDLGYSDIGSYGSEIRTPHLDRLAQEGVRLTQFRNSGRCCPSRAALLTGLHPTQAGLGNMADTRYSLPGYQGRLSDDSVTVAEVLREAGYRTYISGKWHVGTDERYWPHRRGFDRSFGLVNGASSYFNIEPYRDENWFADTTIRMFDDGADYTPPETGFYMTDAFSERAVRFLREHDPSRRFFLYLAYTAPHWPLHALPEDIARYEGRYAEGWDVLRERRLARQRELGVVPEGATLSPRSGKATAWGDLADEERRDYERKMEVYAAMVDRMDQGIGRVLDQLRRSGLAEDTLVMFLSDNGASRAEAVGFTSHLDLSGSIGSERSFTAYGHGWANLGNTPFREFKATMFEGGTASPFIAWYPRALEAGRVAGGPAHIVDILATCLDVAGAAYPETFEGRAVPPTAGVSLVPLLERGDHGSGRTLFWEHLDARAVRRDPWKLVAARGGPWELYDLGSDPTELNDLVDSAPEQARRLQDAYERWAAEVGVVSPAELEAHRLDPK